MIVVYFDQLSGACAPEFFSKLSFQPFSHNLPTVVERSNFSYKNAFPSGDLIRGPLDHKSTDLPTWLPCRAGIFSMRNMEVER